MHCWSLFGFPITVVCANSSHLSHFSPKLARAFEHRFDISAVRTSHVVVYRPDKPEPIKTGDFSYAVTTRPGGVKLNKRDGPWVSIDSAHVTLGPRGDSGATIQLSQLEFLPNTWYKIGYQVSEDGRAVANSDPFLPLRTDDGPEEPQSSGPDVSTPTPRPRASSHVVESSTSRAVVVTPSAVRSSASTVSTDGFESESTSTSSQTPTRSSDGTQASVTGSASAATSEIAIQTGAAIPCRTFSLSTWSWSLLFLPVLRAF